MESANCPPETAAMPHQFDFGPGLLTRTTLCEFSAWVWTPAWGLGGVLCVLFGVQQMGLSTHRNRLSVFCGSLLFACGLSNVGMDMWASLPS